MSQNERRHPQKTHMSQNERRHPQKTPLGIEPGGGRGNRTRDLRQPKPRDVPLGWRGGAHMSQNERRHPFLNRFF